MLRRPTKTSEKPKQLLVVVASEVAMPDGTNSIQSHETMKIPDSRDTVYTTMPRLTHDSWIKLGHGIWTVGWLGDKQLPEVAYMMVVK
ncbi:TPA: hypothetical protein ACH3X3_008926 [Trebouxia sp. C0006]